MLPKWSYLTVCFIALSLQGFADDANPGIFVSGRFESTSQKPQPEANSNPGTSKKIQPLVELKAGYFFFSDSRMRKIYDEGGLDLQISGSAPIWKWLQIYGSVEYLEKRGKSLNGHHKAKVWEVPLSLGLKSIVRMGEQAQYYVTLGPRYFFFHMHTKSSCVNKTLNQNGLGGFVGTGFNFLPVSHFLIDVFGEYSYARLNFHPSKKHVHGRKVQVGGFAFGIGLGYAF